MVMEVLQPLRMKFIGGHMLRTIEKEVFLTTYQSFFCNNYTLRI